MDKVLSIWAIYAQPTDMPYKFVARRHAVTEAGSEPTADCLVADELEPLRETMRMRGLSCLGRDEQDEPQIVESWV